MSIGGHCHWLSQMVFHDVGDDGGTLGVWPFSYFKESRVIIYNDEVLWLAPGCCCFSHGSWHLRRNHWLFRILLLVLLAYMLHFVILPWISEFITGQHSTSLALRLDFYMPIRGLDEISLPFPSAKKLGQEFFHPWQWYDLVQIVHLPFPSTLGAWLNLTLAFVSGHPRLMISLRSCRDSSLVVSSGISSSFRYQAGTFDCIRWTISTIAFSNFPFDVSGSGARDSMSGGTTSFPGLYSRV